MYISQSFIIWSPKYTYTFFVVVRIVQSVGRGKIEDMFTDLKTEILTVYLGSVKRAIANYVLADDNARLWVGLDRLPIDQLTLPYKKKGGGF